MAPLTFADTHNMIAFLSKSDASAGFDEIVDFLNAQVIHYALMVNPTVYVSCIKQFWATALIKKVNDVVRLQALNYMKKVVITEDIIRQDLRLDDADGVECLPTEEIFVELAPQIGQPRTNLFVPWARLSYALPQVESLISLRGCIQIRGRIDAIDADEDITLVDMETEVDLDDKLHGRIEKKDDDNAATKEVNDSDPIVFDDEKVTMTMAQTLIKIKAKKARILDEQMAKRLHDEEVEQAAAREKQEQDDFKRA
nr:hypothetical protein [Tanacetum cinerariifolium]